MEKFINCKIIDVGKRRDGGTRYWCMEHKADATAKYGKPAKKCRYAHIPAISPDEILKLNVDNYKGGVAIWGAIPPIYDTTQRPIDQGIHVHARCKATNLNKEIDNTYRAVRLISKHKNIPQEGIVVHELEAIYYMVTSVFGYTTKYVECTRCSFSHLDKDWFSVHPHRRHLCAGCGNYFQDTDTAIGNPIRKVQELFGGRIHSTIPAMKTLDIRQDDYPEGIQIWGSNPAILWTGTKAEEEGIHVHAFAELGDDPPDDTYSCVTIDGIRLDPIMVRIYMAQNALPHIVERVVDARCPECNESHFDTGELAFTPHENYCCHRCGLEFHSKGRMRKTIGNPIVGILKRLSQNAPYPPRKHKSHLLPETL